MKQPTETLNDYLTRTVGDRIQDPHRMSAASEWLDKRRAAESRFMQWYGCCGHGCKSNGDCDRVNVALHRSEWFERDVLEDEELAVKYLRKCPKFIKQRVEEFVTDLALKNDKVAIARQLISEATSDLSKAVAYSKGLTMLREELEKSRDDLMALQGSPLGFCVDKKYEWDAVRDALAEGLLRGFRPHSNEINIIAGRFYGAQQGYKRLLAECGATQIKTSMEVPQIDGDRRALVGCSIEFILNGKRRVLEFTKKPHADHRIPVRINAGSGDDQTLGKATRKLYKKAVEFISGFVFDEHDADPEEPTANDVVSGVVVDPTKRTLERVEEAASLDDLVALYSEVELNHPTIIPAVKDAFSKRKKALSGKGGATRNSSY